MNSSGNLKIALTIVSAVFFTGCIATSKEIVDLRDDINQLQIKLNEVQRNQAELAEKMDSVNVNMIALSEKLEENKNSMSLVSQRIDDIEIGIVSKVAKIAEKMQSQPSAQSTASELPPSELYRLAYDDFVRGRYEIAITGFKDFVDKYPDATLAPYAMYYLSESHYSKSMFAEALAGFENIEKIYPKSDIIVSSKYKKALTLEKLNRADEAKVVYEEVINAYPASQEAQSAAERLKQK